MWILSLLLAIATFGGGFGIGGSAHAAGGDPVVTANDTAELAQYATDPGVSVINLVYGNTYTNFNGFVLADRELTIHGNGAEIQVGTGFDVEVVSRDSTVGSPRTYAGKGIFDIRSGGVLNVDNVTLRHVPVGNDPNPIFVVFNVRDGGELELDQAKFYDFYGPNVQADSNTVGISFGVHSDPGLNSKVTVTNSEFGSSNAWREAINIRGGTATISNNVLTGTQYPERLRDSDRYEYGIYVYGGTVTITNNTIAGYDSHLTTDYSSSGIAVLGYYNTTLTVSDNTISNNYIGFDVTNQWSDINSQAVVTVNDHAMNNVNSAGKAGYSVQSSNTIYGNVVNIFSEIEFLDDSFTYLEPRLSITTKTLDGVTFAFAAAGQNDNVVTLQQSTDGGDTWTPAATTVTLDKDSASAVVAGLDPQGDYLFRLVVTGSGAYSGYSNFVRLKAYTVSYDDNGSTGGTPPADDALYASGDTVTIKGNTGDLVRTGHTFTGWNAQADGQGTPYSADDTFAVGSANVTLYAAWTPNLYTIAFESNGGSAVSVVTATYGSKITAPAAPTRAGYLFGGWFKDEGLTNAWSFTEDTVPLGGTTLYAKWNYIPVVTESTPSKGTETGVDVLVNGKIEKAGIAKTVEKDGKVVTTVEVDEAKLEQRLAAEGNQATITIPVAGTADAVVGELNGRMVKSMEEKQATVEIRTDKATYKLPANEINIDAISSQLGASVELQDIKVRIEISSSPENTVKVVENAAEAGSFTLVLPPLEFSVQAVFGGQSVEVTKFNVYVERTVAIPDGIDPNRITTGVVVEADGSVRHVPTKVVQRDGRYYAVINSLTNSTYSVVWHPLTFADVEGHWAQNAVNNMSSRMVVNSATEKLFEPDRDITRSEFAAAIVRALGLRLEKGAAPFRDVSVDDEYNSAIKTAAAFNLINGFEDGTFRPNAPITREQAMTIIAKAMSITGLKDKLDPAASEQLARYADGGSVAAWAQDGVAYTIEAGIVNGREGGKLAPQAFITRAEAAAIIERLLKKSELI